MTTTIGRRVAIAAALARRERLELERRDTPLDVIRAEFLPGVEAIAAIVNELLDAVEGVGTVAAAPIALEEAAKRIDIAPFQRVAFRAYMRGAMLGAEDSHVEVFRGEPVEVETFTRKDGARFLLDKPPIPPEFITSGKLRPKPFDQAIDRFRERGIVTKDVWERMTQRAATDSFTVAYLTGNRAIEVMREEITRSLTDAEWGEGPVLTDLRAYRRRLAQRMAEKGWLPGDEGGSELARLSPHHVETVFRNGAMGAYSDGRRIQMSQPHVMAARPYWQIVTVNDGPPRQRRTHQNVHGWVMRADDPGWARSYPPFGHNCRCRVVARSAKWVESNNPTIHTGQLPDLPDKGWVTRAAPPMPPPGPVLPEPSPAAPPPRSRGGPEVPDVVGMFDPDAVRKPPKPRRAPRRPRAPKVKRAPRRRQVTHQVLRDATPRSAQPVSDGGINVSLDLRLEAADGKEVRAIFKPSAGEKEVSRAIPVGTMHRREAAISAVDDLIGGGGRVVPSTVSREVNGRVGSVQAWADDGAAMFDLPLEEVEDLLFVPERAAGNPSVRRMFLLDVTMQNTDRHGANVLWRRIGGKQAERLEAIAIDNGFALPVARSSARLRMPAGMDGDATMSKLVRLDEASAKALRKLTPTKLAKTLRAQGIERDATRAAMIRVEALKRNPNVIAELDLSRIPTTDVALNGQGVTRVGLFWDFSHEAPRELLDDATIRKIDRILDRAYK